MFDKYKEILAKYDESRKEVEQVVDKLNELYEETYLNEGIFDLLKSFENSTTKIRFYDDNEEIRNYRNVIDTIEFYKQGSNVEIKPMIKTIEIVSAGQLCDVGTTFDTLYIDVWIKYYDQKGEVWNG